MLGWKKLVLIKYYHKMSDVDIGNPLKHPIWVLCCGWSNGILFVFFSKQNVAFALNCS